MIIVFWNSFDHTIATHCLMNPETAVTCTRGLFNQVVCAVIQLSIVNTLIALRTNYHTVSSKNITVQPTSLDAK